MGWTTLDTRLCDRCGVYCAEDEVRSHVDGTSYCRTCGMPSFEVPVTRQGRKPSPMTVALGVCAGIFLTVVTIAELASG